MGREAPIGYLVIGHACQDILPDGSLVPGGTATYSALVAHRLGRLTAVLTAAAPDLELFPQLPAILTARSASQATTRFENRYTEGERRQYLRAHAAPISLADLPAAWRTAQIVHLGPVAQEVDPKLIELFPQALVGVTPQGWMRCWGQDGQVHPAAWESAEWVLERAGAVVLSPEDVGHDRDLIAAYAQVTRLLVVTLGPEGALVYDRGRPTRHRAFQVEVRDPTGAGDAFATGFLIRYAETGDLHEAARFANGVASFMIEGLGAAASFSREDVEWRLAHGRMRP